MNKNKKKYELKKQEKPNFCVPSVCQAILRNYSINLSQEQIAEKINCTKRGVLFGENLMPFFKSYNLLFSYFNYNETPFNDPCLLLELQYRENRDIIISIGEKTDKMHVFLLTALNNGEISLLNPNAEEITKENLEEIIRKMYLNKCGGFGIVKKVK